MKLALIVLGIALAAPAAPAIAKHRPQADYATYAGEPIQEFKFSHLYNWQRTGDKTVVVWTKPNTAYLLTLANNCDALSGRVTVQIGGVDGIEGRLQAGMGDIVVGQLRCRVNQIQPVDLAAMKVARG